MNEELLVKSNFIYKDENKIIYLNSFFKAFNALKGDLCKSFASINIEETYFNDDSSYLSYLKNNKISSNFCYLLKDEGIEFKGAASNYQNARKLGLDILYTLKMSLKNICSICALEGSLNNDEDTLSLVYVSNDKLINLINIKISNPGDLYLVSGKLSYSTMLDILSTFNDEDGLILNSFMSKEDVILLPYKDTKQGVRLYCEEVYSLLLKEGIKASLVYSSDNTLIRRKEARKEGDSLFVELGPKEEENKEARLFLLNEEYSLVPLDKLVNKIQKKQAILNKRLYQRNVDEYLNFESTHSVELCEECYKNKVKENTFVPFSQNLKKCECNVCKMKSTRVIIVE